MARPLSDMSASRGEDVGAAAARYAVVCRCGWTSRGDREETALEIECDGCGAPQFVLPHDVYPADAPVPKGKKPARPKPPKSPTPATEPPDPSRKRRAIRQATRKKPAAGNETEPATTSTKISVPAELQKGRRIFTPLRLLIATGILLFAGTAYWTMHRNSVLTAEHDFKTHADAGIVKLRDGRVGEAVAELEMAVAALDRLERDDARARQVRQMLREAKAIDQLSEATLFEMLTEFDAHRAAGDDWAGIFRDRFAGRWIVLVTSAWKDPDNDGRIVLDFPLSIGGAPVRLMGDLNVFEKLSLSEKPRQVIVAAQLQACHRVDDPALEWQAVTVTGYLIPKGKRYEFRVTELKERITDAQWFLKKKRAIPVGKPEAWYALGKWAGRRGAFYRDGELLKLSSEAYLTGITREKETLALDDGEGLLKLAAKCETFGLPASLSKVWVFEAHRRRWMAHRKTGEPSFVELIRPLSEDLPGCLTSPESPDKKLAAAYARDPLGTYRKGTAAQQKLMHRMFYVEIRLHEITRLALPDGSNGLAVAKQIESALPEYAELARTYRDRGMAYQKKHAGALDRAAAIELAEQFRKQKQPDEAKEVLRNWLKSRIARRREDGNIGLKMLADDYERLLGDRKTAFAFLNEAFLKNPKTAGIAERMNRLGYVLRDGRWVEDDGMVAKPAPKIDKEPVSVGMSPKQVRAAMIGPPDAITRVASRRTVHEIWVYGTRAESRWAIHFQRPHTVPPAQAQVVNVSRIAAANRKPR
eukprot:g8453.t1